MDRATIDKVARLARLDLSEEERARFGPQLGSIIAYADALAALDTSGVEPFLHAAAARNVFREDQPRVSLSPDEALACAPGRKGDYFLVPRVVDGVDAEC